MKDCFNPKIHNLLKELIISWYPILMDHPAEEDALEMIDFEFNLDAISSKEICLELAEMIERRALVVYVTTLVRYLSEHSNLSNSYQTLYQRISLIRRNTRKPLFVKK